MKGFTASPSKSQAMMFPAGLLALGLATAGFAHEAAASNADATTSFDADQAAIVFDASFSNRVKVGRAPATVSTFEKPWSNTLDRNFYGH